MNLHEREFTHRDLGRVLRHRLPLILGCSFLLGIFLTAVALSSEARYEARGSIQVADGGGGLNVLSEFLSVGSGSEITSEIEIIRSRTMTQSIITEMDLQLEVKDVTYGNALTKAIMFVISDHLVRGKRGIRIDHVEFPYSSEDKIFILTVLDKDGNYKISAPGGNLGDGKPGELFTSDQLNLTVTSLKGSPGTKFKLTPRSSNMTYKKFMSNLKVGTLGGASKTNLIQITYSNSDPSLAADVVNALIEEYNRLDIEWKSKQGQTQTEPIEKQIAKVSEELKLTEDALEDYRNAHGVVALPQEAALSLNDLANREAQSTDLDIRISTFQGIHTSLAESLSDDTFSVPPVLTGDPLIQQLSADHASLTMELNNLLVDLTENHPSVISKRNEITTVRENILGAISATINGLIEQKNDVDNIIGGIKQRLYEIPGIERQLLDLTMKRDGAIEVNNLLMKRMNEAMIITTSLLGGHRVIDSAVTPAEPVSPSIKTNVAIGLGLGFILGLLLAIFIEITDPWFRRSDQLSSIIAGCPVGVISRENSEDISRAASILAISALKCKGAAIACICPGRDSTLVRMTLQSTISELTRGVSRILFIEPVSSGGSLDFFGVKPSPGLSELSGPTPPRPQITMDGRILVIPPGSDPSSTYVSNTTVRKKLENLLSEEGLGIFYLSDFAKDPAQSGWLTFTGGVVLLLRQNSELQSDIISTVETIKSNGCSVLAALVIG